MLSSNFLDEDFLNRLNHSSFSRSVRAKRTSVSEGKLLFACGLNSSSSKSMLFFLPDGNCDAEDEEEMLLKFRLRLVESRIADVDEVNLLFSCLSPFRHKGYFLLQYLFLTNSLGSNDTSQSLFKRCFRFKYK